VMGIGHLFAHYGRLRRRHNQHSVYAGCPDTNASLVATLRPVTAFTAPRAMMRDPPGSLWNRWSETMHEYSDIRCWESWEEVPLVDSDAQGFYCPTCGRQHQFCCAPNASP
jgi:hypothetical protein